MKKTTLLLIFLFAAYIINAVNVKFQEHQITQPDGTVINCFVSGDEFFNWIHDEDGYSIIKGSDGYYYYAVKDNDKIIASEYKVNSINPADAGIPKWVKISKKEYLNKRDAYMAPIKSGPVKAPHIGDFNNIVIYIKFSGESEISTTREVYDNKLNPETGNTLKSYFKEVSYDQLTISSTHYPACETPSTSNFSYEDSHTRDYFQPYDESTNPNGYVDNDEVDESTEREHQLLADALTWINDSNLIDPGLNVDGDGDGYVDNVCFMIKGNSDGWSDLLWAHRWALYTKAIYINGKRVYDYTFQPENQVSVRTLCHEMFHALGAPDLYHYYEGTDLSPVGSWDLMESGNGHMGAYMKLRYANGNWISEIPEITTAGTYELNPLTSPTNNCYKIASPNTTEEYFVVEYRKQSGDFESNLPGDGLIVYRINTNFDGNANYDGVDVFDGVYIYRPGGTTTVDGTINTANYSSDVGRTSIDDGTSPSSYLSDGSKGGLSISNVTTAGNTISFYVAFRPGMEIKSTESGNTTSKKIPVEIVFTEPVTGFEISDIQVTLGEAENFTQVHDSVYTIDVVPERAGKIEVSIENDVAEDLEGNGNLGSDWSIYFDYPAGITDINDSGIKIYPNPSSGIFNLELNNDYLNCDIRIIDIAGRVIENVTISKTNRYILNLSDYSKGIYIVNINIDNKVFNNRLIIK
ncbi:MAG: M6 family metalloprotease domain-containing protein [Bacteroidales bacterium]|nr:M6 family metalloprotease domain-containing protein [Bacteroidales bacterium]